MSNNSKYDALKALNKNSIEMCLNAIGTLDRQVTEVLMSFRDNPEAFSPVENALLMATAPHAMSFLTDLHKYIKALAVTALGAETAIEILKAEKVRKNAEIAEMEKSGRLAPLSQVSVNIDDPSLN